MREIVFRGKRLDNGEWVEGYYISSSCSEIEAVIIPASSFAELNRNLRLEVDEWWEVDPTTVGQDTGLTDKNGKKIYEGDILDCGDRITYVSWHKGCGTWDCKFVRYKDKLCSNGIENAEWKYRATVIGNIHDNPEMLGGWR